MKRKDPNNADHLKIGSNIRKWRSLKNIKQKDLARALCLSEAAISNIENDKMNITVRQLSAIAATLDISILYLFSDPVQKFSIDQPNKRPGSVHHQNEYILDALLSAMQQKDKKLQSALTEIKRTLDQLVGQKNG